MTNSDLSRRGRTLSGSPMWTIAIELRFVLMDAGAGIRSLDRPKTS